MSDVSAVAILNRQNCLVAISETPHCLVCGEVLDNGWQQARFDAEPVAACACEI